MFSACETLIVPVFITLLFVRALMEAKHNKNMFPWEKKVNRGEGATVSPRYGEIILLTLSKRPYSQFHVRSRKHGSTQVAGEFQVVFVCLLSLLLQQLCVIYLK